MHTSEHVLSVHGESVKKKIFFFNVTQPYVKYGSFGATGCGARAKRTHNLACGVCTCMEHVPSVRVRHAWEAPFAALVVHVDAKPVLITRLLESTNLADDGVDVWPLTDDPYAKAGQARRNARRVQPSVSASTTTPTRSSTQCDVDGRWCRSRASAVVQDLGGAQVRRHGRTCR